MSVSLRRGLVALLMGVSMALAGLSAVPGTAASAASVVSCSAAAAGHVRCASLLTPGSKLVSGSALKSRVAATGAAVAPTGLAPLDLRSAYGLDSAAITGGVGQTVAVVTPFYDADAEPDLQAYRSQYNLPACPLKTCLEIIDQAGNAISSTSHPPPGQLGGWDLPVAQSMDMISAVCPNCHILLVEATSTSIFDLGQAENEAVDFEPGGNPGAKFVTNTWTMPEAQTIGATGEPGDDLEYFTHPGVEITAPDGTGAGLSAVPNYPAASPDVIAVGGTTLTRSTGSRPWTEVAWGSTGSGCSPYEPKPSWQTDTGCADRMLNDAAAVADDVNSPVAFFNDGNWTTGGGNTDAAAIVAAVLALGGNPPADTTGASYLYAHRGDVTDITTGSDGTCAVAYYCMAGVGYDGPTGLGTPDGGIGPQAPAQSMPGSEAVYDPISGSLEVYGVNSSRQLVEDYWRPGSSGGWAGWHVLPGNGPSFAGHPVALYDPADGKLEVYVRTAGGDLDEFCWYPASGSGWSGPMDLGGSVSTDPAAVYDPLNGSEEIWATRSDGTLEEDSWRSDLGWSGWVNHGGSFQGSPSAVFNPGSGNMEYYAAASSGSLKQLSFNPSTGFTPPTGFTDLGGGSVTSPTAIYNPVSGSLEVYIANTSGEVYEKYWHPGNNWSAWLDRSAKIIDRPEADWNPISGSLEVYGESSAGALMEDYWNVNGGWSGWKNLGGGTGCSVLPCTVSLSTGLYNPGDGHLEIYADEKNGTLQEKYWDPATGWSAWIDLGGTLIAL